MADPLKLRSCVVHLDRRRVERQNTSTPLTTQEAGLLAFLSERPGQTVARDTLFTDVLGYAANTRSRALDAAVRRLRHKIEVDPAHPDHLLTVHGEGYCWVPMEVERTGAGQAPRYRTDFVGRADLVARLGELLDHEALITVHGPGGVGKTRLVAEALAAHDLDAAWVTVPPGADVPTLASCVARALEIDDGADTVAAVGTALEARRGLHLVLDAAEAAVEATAELAHTWVDGWSDLRVVITSRELLRITAERPIAVEPLPAAQAIELLLGRAARARGGRPWSGASRQALEPLVDRLDRLPLAVELAASRAVMLSATALLERLDDRFTLLRRPQRDGTPRHATLHAMLDWSWQLLTEDERRVLLCVAILQGPFTMDVVEVLTDVADPLDTVSSLCAKSLIHSREDGTLILLDSVRDFARTQAATPPWQGVMPRARRQLATNAPRLVLAPIDQLAAAHLALEEALPQAADAVLAACDASRDQAAILTLAEAARRHLHGRDLQRVAITATSLLVRGADPEVLRAWLDVLTAEEDAGPDHHRAVGQLLLAQGHVADAEARLRHAAEADDGSAAEALVLCGECRLRSADPLGAETVLQHARERAPQGSLVWSRATALLAIAVRDGRGKQQRALELFTAASEAQHTLGRPRDAAVTQANMANLHYLQGRIRDALTAYAEAAEILSAAGDLRALLMCRSNLAVVHDCLGDADASAQAHHQVVTLAERLGDHASAALAKVNLAQHLSHSGQHPRALQLVAEACAQADTEGAAGVAVYAWMVRARLTGPVDLQAATHAAEQAWQILGTPDPDTPLSTELRVVHAELLATTDAERAAEQLRLAEQHIGSLGGRQPLDIGLQVAFARLALAQDDPDEAARRLEQARATVSALQLSPRSRLSVGLHQVQALLDQRRP